MLYSRPVNDKRIQITPAVEVGNTDLHIMNKVRAILEEMGCNFSWQEYRPKGKKTYKYFYKLRSQHAGHIKVFLENLLPFMIGSKKAYGETLLSFVSRRLEKAKGRPLKHTPYDEEDIEFVRSSTTTRETPTGEDIVYSSAKVEV